MSLLEGMACGCYPIVSDLPSLREWITDQDNGRLVPVGDVDMLSAAMLAAADAGPTGLAPAIDRNRQLVETRASQVANQQMMLAEYARVLGRAAAA
jgi:glycosyltransferase involved in cell wall biosynthesis